jgi:NADH dehydrogenase
MSYDHLVFCNGCWNELFRNGKRKENAIPMKTLNDAIEMRNNIKNLEKAAICKDIRES